MLGFATATAIIGFLMIPVVLHMSTVSAQAPTPTQVSFTAHMASGKQYLAQAKLNSLLYTYDATNGQLIHIDYSTDQILCSGFGNNE